MEQELKLAIEAAEAGAQVVRSLWGKAHRVEHKRRFDFVTEADKASQEAITALIRRSFPDHAILAEEDAHSSWPVEGPVWVIDPLDGTTNFIHGYKQVGVSVGLVVGGRPVVGVVVDVAHGERFWAGRGMGAWSNEGRIRVSGVEDPAQALVLTGFPFREKQLLDPYLDLFKEIFLATSGVRRAGAAALDLVHVAAGRADGFWELGLKPWDLAAGMVILEEAGGVWSDFEGGDGALWSGDIVAGNPGIHRWLKEICSRYFPRLRPGQG